MKTLSPAEIEKLFAYSGGHIVQRDLKKIEQSIPPDLITAVISIMLGFQSTSVTNWVLDVTAKEFPRSIESRGHEWLDMLHQCLISQAISGDAKVRLFNAIGQGVLQEYARFPQLYVRFIQICYEIRRLNIDLSLATQAIELPITEARKADKCIVPHLKRMVDRWLFLSLVGRDTSKNSLLAALSELGNLPFTDVDFTLMAAHLCPIISSFDADIMMASLRNLLGWMSEEPTTCCQQAFEDSAKAYLRNELDTLPVKSVNEIAMSALIVGSLVKWLPSVTDDTRFPNVLEMALRLLALLPTARSQAEHICQLLSEPSLKSENYMAGVDLLDSMLTSLQAYRINQTTDYIREFFWTAEDLQKDQQILETLGKLAAREDLQWDVRHHAFQTLLQAGPPNTVSLLRQLSEDRDPNDPLLHAGLDAVKRLRIFEFAEVASILWSQHTQNKTVEKKIIEDLLGIGTKEIVNTLLMPSFDAEDDEIRNLAMDAIARAGFPAELDREKERRLLVSMAMDKFRLETGYSAARQERVEYEKQKEVVQNDYEGCWLRDLNVRSDRLQRRVYNKGRATNLDVSRMAEAEHIYQLEREIEELRVRVIEPLATRISDLEQIAGTLYRELDDIETQMDDCYRQRQNCEREAIECRRRRTACVSRLADIRAELDTHARMRPSRRRYEEDDLESFESAVQEWHRRGTELRSQLDDIEEEVADIGRRENQLTELLQQLQDQIEELTRSQTRLARALAQSRAQLEDCRRQIGEALATVSRLETEVDNCREHIRQLQSEFNALVTSTREAIGQYDKVQQKINAERTREQQGMEQSINNIRSRRMAEEALSSQLIELAQRFDRERRRFEDLGNIATRQTSDNDALAIGLSFQSADDLRKSQIQKWYRINLYDIVGRSTNFANRYGPDLLKANHLITEARKI
jgi:hypothetical protein